MSKLLILSLLFVLFSLIETTQLSELPEQFLGNIMNGLLSLNFSCLGLISNEIKQFYSGLTLEEQEIIDKVDASNSTETNYATAYKQFNKKLGEKAEEYVNKEAAKILKLDQNARNFYLQILQLPNQLKLIGGGTKEDWKQIAKELVVLYEKLSTGSKSTLKEHYPEVSETLTGHFSFVPLKSLLYFLV